MYLIWTHCRNFWSKYHRVIFFIAVMITFCAIMAGCAARMETVEESILDYPDTQLEQPVLTLPEIINQVQLQENLIKTIKSVQKITFRDRLNHKTQKVKAFIGFQRPECYRIQLTTVLGIDVLDILHCNNQTRIKTHKNQTIDQDSQDFDKLKEYFPFEQFPSYFIHDLNGTNAVLKIVRDFYVLTFFREEAGAYVPDRDIWLYPDTLLVARIDFFHKGYIQASFHYSDFQPVTGGGNTTVYLPYRSEIHLPMKKISLFLEASQHHLNTALSPEMFRMND